MMGVVSATLKVQFPQPKIRPADMRARISKCRQSLASLFDYCVSCEEDIQDHHLMALRSAHSGFRIPDIPAYEGSGSKPLIYSLGEEGGEVKTVLKAMIARVKADRTTLSHEEMDQIRKVLNRKGTALERRMR